MRGLPIMLDTRGRQIGLVGDTPMADAKFRLLSKTEAEIVRIAQPVDPAAFAGLSALFIATGDEAEDARISALAVAVHVPVNVVDRPHLSTFSMPAVVDRSPVVIAIGTEGTAPGPARAMRQDLEATLPQGLGALADAAGAFRDRTKVVLSDAADRRRFWDDVFDALSRERLSGLGSHQIEEELSRRLDMTGTTIHRAFSRYGVPWR